MPNQNSMDFGFLLSDTVQFGAGCLPAVVCLYCFPLLSHCFLHFFLNLQTPREQQLANELGQGDGCVWAVCEVYWLLSSDVMAGLASVGEKHSPHLNPKLQNITQHALEFPLTRSIG